MEHFVSHLATERQVSASIQRQAHNALVFLYRDVLHQPLENTIAPVRRTRQPRPPTVLTQAEVQRLLAAMTGRHALMARLLSDSGLRLLEGIRLRLRDVDVGQNLIFVRGGKGGKDRTTILPRNLRNAVQAQTEAVKALHHQDLEAGGGEVYIPEALARKYPRPREGCHTRRHSFVTHMLENGVNIRVLQELLGHAEVKTTEMVTHVLAWDLRPSQSPLDRLQD